MKQWKLQQRRIVFEPGPFSIREDVLVSPRTGQAGRYHVMECPDWVNVIALTEQGLMVLVRQYRFGAERVTLEIPGGVLEPGEKAADGAVRELREETGYVGEEPIELGYVEPNPALQSNRCTTFLIPGCRPEAQQDLDPGEDVEVVLEDVHALEQAIRGGRVTHSLVVAAMGLYRLYLDQDPTPREPRP